jgi:hypothetical protein
MIWQSGIKRVYVKQLYRDIEDIKKMKDLHISIVEHGPFSILEYSPYE